MPNELLPSNIQFGTVVGRFGSAPLIAGDADGLPDFSPATGLTITFTPSTAAVIDATATPAPVTIEMVPIVCGLDSQGYLVGGDGQRGVKLIATDDTDINPSGWTYSVTFLRAGAKVAAFRDFSMSLPAGTTKDIALTIPVPSSSGVSLNQAQAAEAAAVAAASSATTAASTATTAAATAVAATVSKVDIATGQMDRALIKGGTWIDPAHPYYGADPTGVADSAPAWRAAAAAAVASGAPIIPSPGTYLFASKDSATDIFVPLTSGITICPRALGDVTIKMGAAIRSWVSVFGSPVTSPADLSKFDIRNMVFDGNSIANPYPDVAAPRRYLMRAGVGKGLRFINNRVVRWDGRNTISFNASNGITGGGVGGMSDIIVSNNSFTEMGGPRYHDTSVIYVGANNYTISDNTIVGVELGGKPNNIMASIEVHGSNYRVLNNYSENTATAMPLCGPDPTDGGLPSVGFTITGNTFRNCGRGFSFFSFTVMDQGVISYNIVDIDTDRWPPVVDPAYKAISGETSPNGFGHPAFVRIQGVTPLLVGQALTNWKIRNNHFSWRGSGGLIGDTCYQTGIGAAPPDQGVDFNIQCIGNVFINCPSNYFFAYAFNTLSNWTVDDIVINPCSSELGTTNQSLYRFRNGTAVTNCHFGGTFIDDKVGATSRIKWWLLGDTGTGDTVPTFTNVDMDGIRVTTAATTPPGIMATQPAVQPVRCTTAVQRWVAPTGNASFTPGSAITDMETGQTRVQTAAPAGAVFDTEATRIKAQAAALAVPASVQALTAPGKTVNLNAATIMRPWYVASALGNTRRVNICVLGDSITQGQGASTMKARWVSRLNATLRSRLGVTSAGGRGYIAGRNNGITSFTWPAVYSGVAHTPSFDFGPGRANVVMSAAGDFVTYALHGTAVDIMYQQQAATGTAYYKLDGGSAVTFSTAAAGGTVDGVLKRVSLGASGDHTLEIGWSSGNAVYLDGVIEYDGDETSGVTVHDCGHFGFNSFNWSTGTNLTTQWPASVKALAPDLVVIAICTNDPVNSILPAATITNLGTTIAALRAALPNAYTPIIMAPYASRNGQESVWPGYVDAMYTIAQNDGKAVVADLSLRIPNQSAVPNYGTYSDSTHPSDAGHGLIASHLTSFILPG